MFFFSRFCFSSSSFLFFSSISFISSFLFFEHSAKFCSSRLNLFSNWRIFSRFPESGLFFNSSISSFNCSIFSIFSCLSSNSFCNLSKSGLFLNFSCNFLFSSLIFLISSRELQLAISASNSLILFSSAFTCEIGLGNGGSGIPGIIEPGVGSKSRTFRFKLIIISFCLFCFSSNALFSF